ncbi:hypothetical protein [Roseateles oligotrophus]|uniref:Mobilization protein n=1 Tax=Roseateles oligotrophus TaxID=1769250 RepID=A0ABT2Y8G4_9BURK|nr:hypothetical protein [Roseateles oligotrophus]MCV2366578.1 hypothetical protein [Roseateles oligotrophus]
MSRQNIEAIEQQLIRLKNRRAQLLARESDAARKRRTRQAVIIGTWIMTNKPELATAIARKLPREQDRATFGFATAKGNSPTPMKVDILLPLELPIASCNTD